MRTWMWVALVAAGTVVLVVVAVRAALGGRRVPTKAKLALAGALVWLLFPVDLIPDVAFPAGVLDDLAVLIAAVRYALGQLEAPTEPIERRLDRRRAIDASDRRPDWRPDHRRPDDRGDDPSGGR